MNADWRELRNKPAVAAPGHACRSTLEMTTRKTRVLQIIVCLAMAASLVSAAGSRIPELSFTATFDDSTGDRDYCLDADETGRVVLVIKNSGAGPARDLTVRLTQQSRVAGVEIPESTSVTEVAPNREQRVVILVRAKRTVPTGTLALKIEVLEPHFEADADPAVLKFETHKFEPPNLVISDKGVVEGKIVPKNSVTVSLIVHNDGTGRAEGVTAAASVPSGVSILEGDGKYDLGTLAPGAEARIDMPIFVGAQFVLESLRIALNLSDRRPEFNKRVSTALPVNRPVNPVIVVNVPGEERPRGPVPQPPTLSSDVDAAIPTAGRVNPQAVALVIANRSYDKPGIPEVEFADNDARVVQDYLVQTLGFQREDVIGRENFRKSDFGEWFGTTGSPDGKLYNRVAASKGSSDVFVYYVGHGAPDIESKTAYFLPVDADPDWVRLNGYSVSTFLDNLSRLPARSVTVVIDASFNGMSDKGMLIAQASPLVVAVNPPTSDSKLNVFLASSGSEAACRYPAQRHGLFTYYFLKALQASAGRKDRQGLTLGELQSCVADSVSYRAARMDRRQTPTFEGDPAVQILRAK
jgi:hypothetical protein